MDTILNRESKMIEIHGMLRGEMRDTRTGRLLMKFPREGIDGRIVEDSKGTVWEENVIVFDASLLLAQLARNNGESLDCQGNARTPDTRVSGIISLAVGLGDPSATIRGLVGVSSDIYHSGLVVDVGGAWNLQSPPAATSGGGQRVGTYTGDRLPAFLVQELTRKTVTPFYVDVNGNRTVKRTNIIDLETSFDEGEAVAALVEMGLFGGDGALNVNGGTQVNYKTFPVINKPNTAQLSFIWRLTF